MSNLFTIFIFPQHMIARPRWPSNAINSCPKPFSFCWDNVQMSVERKHHTQEKGNQFLLMAMYFDRQDQVDLSTVTSTLRTPATMIPIPTSRIAPQRP